MRHGFVQRALGATLVVLVTACTNGSSQAESGAAARADGLPAIYSSGAIYQCHVLLHRRRATHHGEPDRLSAAAIGRPCHRGDHPEGERAGGDQRDP